MEGTWFSANVIRNVESADKKKKNVVTLQLQKDFSHDKKSFCVNRKLCPLYENGL